MKKRRDGSVFFALGPEPTEVGVLNATNLIVNTFALWVSPISRSMSAGTSARLASSAMFL